MTDSAWLAVASFWPSLAMAIYGIRTTRITVFKERLDALEDENRTCKEQVRRLREDNEWLMQLAQRQHGERRPRWTNVDRDPPT